MEVAASGPVAPTLRKQRKAKFVLSLLPVYSVQDSSHGMMLSYLGRVFLTQCRKALTDILQ